MPTSMTSSGRLAAVAARWPSVVGVLALILNSAGGADAHVTAMVIILAALCYLAAAALGSRASGWVMVVVASVLVTLAGVVGLDPTTSLIVLGVGFAAYGLLRGQRIDRRELAIQATGFVVFTAIALAAMMSGPVAAAVVAAVAALGHAAWDVVHFVREKAVSRSLTEACFVLDLGLGALLLIAAWTATVA